jgi:hypothetical protein
MSFNKPPLIAHLQRGKNSSRGLSGSWPFYSGSGGTVYDVSSGDGRHATWAGTGSRWTSLDSGYCGSFNGTDDYLTIPNADGLYSFESSGNFSVAMRLAAPSGATGARFVLDNRITSADGWTLDMNDGTMTMTAEGTAVVAASATFTRDGTIRHLAATVSATGGVVMYINGAVVASNTSAVGVPVVTSEQSVYVGSDAGASAFWLGQMSDLRIYNRTLSAEEVALISAGFG